MTGRSWETGWRLILVAVLFTGGACLEAAEGTERPRQAWAVVVGINDYEAVPDCTGAVTDAGAVRRHLAQAGWADEHVLLLDDYGVFEHDGDAAHGGHFRPTRANLEWAIRTWLSSRIRPNDVAVFYFAGHALSLPPKPGALPPSRPGDFLLPSDARVDDLDRTGWRLEEAIDSLEIGSSGALICWLDTSVRGRGRPITEDREAGAVGQRLLSSLTRWPNATAWLAADGPVAAEGGSPRDRSPFTACLLRALGSGREPISVLGALHEMRHDPVLVRQGFRAQGGVPAGLTLESGKVSVAAAPPRQLVVQRGHADRVRDIIVTPDGLDFATSSMDSTLQLWRTADRALVGVFGGHEAGVTSLALSPDGRWIVTGDGAGTVRVWDRVDQQRRNVADTPAPHDGAVVFAGFLPGSKRFVTLDARAGRLLLWGVKAEIIRPRTLTDSPVRLAAHAAVTLRDDDRWSAALAAVTADDEVLLFRADGTRLGAVPAVGRGLGALDLSDDGRILAVGGDDGTVSVYDTRTGATRLRRAFGAPIKSLCVSGARLVAVGTQDHVSLVDLGKNRVAEERPVPAGLGRLQLSGDGHYLVACSRNVGGALHVWQLGEEPTIAMIPVPLTPLPEQTITAFTFTPDARMLLAGDYLGGLHGWSLPAGESQLHMPPNRRQVGALSVSAQGEQLLQITNDGQAQVCDLAQGGKLRTLAGLWSTGAFLPDRRTLVLTRSADLGGDVVLLDTSNDRGRSRTLTRPKAQGTNLAVASTFDRVAVAPNGKLIAAGSSPRHSPLVCVWNVEDGALIHVVRDEQGDSLAGFAFAPDGARLVTAAQRTIRLWALAHGVLTPELIRSHRVEQTITCVAFAPAPALRIGIGTRAGRVLLWKGDQRAPEPLPGAPVDGPVRALAFAPDGRWLAAAGNGKLMRLWTLEDEPKAVPLAPAPNHDAPINALAFWPGSRMLVSGSDDATIRFWSLIDRRLLGTFAAFPAPSPAPILPRSPSGARMPPSWVVFTPDGVFDSSPEAADQVRWVEGNTVRSLDQYERMQFYRPQLTAELRLGRVPAPPAQSAAPPPALVVETTTPRNRREADVDLTVALHGSVSEDVRLYQNGVPVRTRADFQPTSDPRRLVTRVRLRAGVNRFYAMASRVGSPDGRSPVVEVRFDGHEATGRLHVLALGVSRYRRRALQYADADAQEIGKLLHQRGTDAEGNAGYCKVLTNDEVTQSNVENALRELRDAVKNRPQDRLVVFIAGHTAIHHDRFSLLLPPYSFPDGDPARVAVRTAAEGKAHGQDAIVLPYATIYGGLVRMDALQRLVIIDACQAVKVLNDPEVRRIQNYMAIESRQARIAYLFGLGQGEQANEIAELRHGLLTFGLLRGLGGVSPASVPRDLVPTVEALPRNADFDGDGAIGSAELRHFVELTLPALAAHFHVGRPSGDGPSVALRSAEETFVLVPLPTNGDTPR